MRIIFSFLFGSCLGSFILLYSYWRRTGHFLSTENECARVWPVIIVFGCTSLLIGQTPGGPHRHFFLLAIFAMLLLLSLDDWVTQTIRDSDLLLLALLFVIDVFTFGDFAWLDRFIGAFITSLPLYIIHRIRPDALGIGDVLFLVICGFYLGTFAICYAFLLACISALLYALLLLIIRKASRDTPIPLIPFLSFGVAAIILASLYLHL